MKTKNEIVNYLRFKKIYYEVEFNDYTHILHHCSFASDDYKVYSKLVDIAKTKLLFVKDLLDFINEKEEK